MSYHIRFKRTGNQKLYTSSAIQQLADEYLKLDDGNVVTLYEGILGWGFTLMFADADHKVAVVKEVALNEWSSAHTVRFYKQIPKKYADLLAAYYDRIVDEAERDELQKQFDAECDKIAQECEAEGYPSHGENYELRVENLMKCYPELFGDL